MLFILTFMKVYQLLNICQTHGRDDNVTLKMEAAWPSEKMVTYHVSARCH